MGIRVATFSCAALALAASTAWAQCIIGIPGGTGEEYAGWGASVAISGNGEVALVGGPGADEIDGIVRTFTRDASGWVEGEPLFPDPAYAYAAEFGWCVALSHDGNTAAIGAPGDMHGNFSFRWGAVYVFTRDPGSGEWSEQARLTEPAAGPERAFGQAIALSDDGNRLLVGQKENLGDKPYLEDSAWVFARSGDVWSAPVELIGSDLVPEDQFSAALALSPDGSRALVSALGEGQTDGRVFVFKYDGNGWPIEQVLDYPEATGWNSFGNAVDIDGDTIVVGDAWNDDLPPGGDYGFDPDNAGAVHVFDYVAGAWVRQAQFLIAPIRGDGLFQYMFGQVVALSGEHLLVGCPNGGGFGVGPGAVHSFELVDGEWALSGSVLSVDPQEGARFGAALDLAGDGVQYVIGEPSATVDGSMGEGRAQFVDSVSAAYDYDVEPTGSPFTFTFYFLGSPVTVQISAAGDILGIVVDGCDDTPGSFLMSGATLINGGDPIVFDMPWTGWEVEFTDVLVTVAEVGEAAVLDDTGTGTLLDYRFEVSGWLSVDGGQPVFHSGITDPPTSLTAQVTGGYGDAFHLALSDIEITMDVDFGLGDYNPTITVTGAVDATEAPDDSCPGDVDGDGDTDQSDLGVLLASYGIGGGGDLDDDGDTDQSDLGILLADYGCGT